MVDKVPTASAQILQEGLRPKIATEAARATISAVLDLANESERPSLEKAPRIFDAVEKFVRELDLARKTPELPVFESIADLEALAAAPASNAIDAAVSSEARGWALTFRTYMVVNGLMLGRAVPDSHVHALSVSPGDARGPVALLGEGALAAAREDLVPAVIAFDHAQYPSALHHAQSALKRLPTSMAVTSWRRDAEAIAAVSEKLAKASRPNVHAVLQAFEDVCPKPIPGGKLPSEAAANAVFGNTVFVKARYCYFTVGVREGTNNEIHLPDDFAARVRKMNAPLPGEFRSSVVPSTPVGEAAALGLYPELDDAVRLKFRCPARGYDALVVARKKAGDLAPDSALATILFAGHKAPALFHGWREEMGKEVPRETEADEHVEDLVFVRHDGKVRVEATDLQLQGDTSGIELDTVSGTELYLVGHHRFLEYVGCLIHRDR